MIFFIPLADLELFHATDLSALTEREIVERVRADEPGLFEGAHLSIREGVLVIEFPPVAESAHAEAMRLFEKGVQRCRQGDYRKAVGILDRVLVLDPSIIAAYRNLGMAYVECVDVFEVHVRAGWLQRAAQAVRGTFSHGIPVRWCPHRASSASGTAALT